MRKLFAIMAVLWLTGCAGMGVRDVEMTAADQKLTALDHLTAPTVDDLTYAVDDPLGAGTGPTSLKLTMLNLLGVCPAINTKSSGTYTVGTDNPWEKYCGVIYVTGNTEIQAPDAPTSNMSFSVVTMSTAVATIDAYDANEDLILDGNTASPITGGAAGIDSTGTAGDIGVVTYSDSDSWHVSTNGWAAGS